jgi:hypothetical protein
MKAIFATFLVFVLCTFHSLAQNIGIGTPSPHSSAQLEVSSTNKGILIPRMSLAQRGAIGSPAAGLLIFQTDNSPGFYYYTGSSWQAVSAGGGGSGINIPYSIDFGGSLLGARNALQINLTTSYGEKAFVTEVRNVNATGFYGHAYGLGSYAALFTVEPGSISTRALVTNDGNVVLNNISGNTGIGASPMYKLDVNGRMRIRHNVNTAGLWFNKTDNTEGAFLGMFNDTISGWYGTTWQVGYDVKNGRVGIGNLSPKTPLAFASALGNKVSLWGDNATAHYGLGIQSGLMQLYSDNSSGGIAFGFGSSNSFTESARFTGSGRLGIGTTNPGAFLEIQKPSNNLLQLSNTNTLGAGVTNKIYFKTGNYYTNIIESSGESINQASLVFKGWANSDPNSLKTYMVLNDDGQLGVGVTNPNYQLDVFGRMRLRKNIVDNGPPGIWFNKNTTAVEGNFLGTYDDNNLGIWGPGTSGTWKFLFDGNDGTLRMGTTKKVPGYLLHVGGKIVAEEVRVQLASLWPDYVFNEDYELRSLENLESYIQQNKHLPGIEPASVIEKNGLDIGNINRQLTEKVEELTLYIIQIKKELDALKKQVEHKN